MLDATFAGQIERSGRIEDSLVLKNQGGSELLTRQLEALGAVNVESGVDDSANSPRLHRASGHTVPRRADLDIRYKYRSPEKI